MASAISFHRQPCLLQLFQLVEGELRAQELHQQLRAVQQDMGLATVYRGLKLLLQAGRLVGCRRLSSGETVYAPLERDDQHLTCVQCGSSQILPLSPLATGGLSTVLLQGFRPLFHPCEIHGLCSRCQQVEVGVDG